MRSHIHICTHAQAHTWHVNDQKKDEKCHLLPQSYAKHKLSFSSVWAPCTSLDIICIDWCEEGCSWWGLRHANRTSHPIPISLAVRATSAKATKTICIFAFKRIARKLIYKIFTSNLTRWTYPVRKMCTTFYEYQVVISMMCVFVCVFLSFLLPPCACVFVCCLRSYTLNEPRILFASLFQKPFTGAPVNKKPWATVLKVEKPPKHNK